MSCVRLSWTDNESYWKVSDVCFVLSFFKMSTITLDNGTFLAFCVLLV